MNSHSYEKDSDLNNNGICILTADLFYFFNNIIKTINFSFFFPNRYDRIYIWRPLSLNELTTIVSDMELTHLGSEASI